MPRIVTDQPTWMRPGATLETRRFHRREARVWVGEVEHGTIKGWIGNPRTEMHAQQFKDLNLREPTDEEMFEMVLADDDKKEGLKIKELSASIRQSGIRVPIVLTASGKLLDGNRRYYSNKLALRDSPAGEKDRFKYVPAMVLADEEDAELEDAIITEFNFASDFREEWPYFVKAFRVYADHVRGVPNKELEEKFGEPWRLLSKWVKAAELCDRFLDHHEQSYSAKRYALKNFIQFDEMMRGYAKRFDDRDFRESVFDILLADYDDDAHRFRSSKDVLYLDDIYDCEDAWNALLSKKGKTSVTEAETLMRFGKLDSSADTTGKLKRVIGSVEKLNGSANIGSADPELLERLHTLVEGLPGESSEPRYRVEKRVSWLDGMTSLQIASLDGTTLTNLRLALERVLKMADAVTMSVEVVESAC